MNDLITPGNNNLAPLAERLRPTDLDEMCGQTHLLGPQQAFRQMLEAGKVHSMLLWGPAGTGKTTLARLIANYVKAHWLSISAVESGIKEIRQAAGQAQIHLANGERTLVFVDEVHRFNKAQQDAFLPYVEDGTLIFIGATTENPSFEVNRAMLSRCRVYVLKPLDHQQIAQLIDRAMSHPEVNDLGVELEEAAKSLLIDFAQGDARRLLNALELALNSMPLESTTLTHAHLAKVLGEKTYAFDKAGDQYFQQLSALHKSIRGSDPDASLYWMARMLLAGCDPNVIARRLTVIASEDVGNADPRALSVAVDAWEAFRRLGQPEGELALAQAVTYLASAPKSNAAYKAYKLAKEAAKRTASAAVPRHLRNATTKLQQQLGYKQQYHYAHDHPLGFSPGQSYLPEELIGQKYYAPVNRGLESKIAQRLAFLKQAGEKDENDK